MTWRLTRQPKHTNLNSGVPATHTELWVPTFLLHLSLTLF